jgi:hypothetical protein
MGPLLRHLGLLGLWSPSSSGSPSEVESLGRDKLEELQPEPPPEERIVTRLAGLQVQ